MSIFTDVIKGADGGIIFIYLLFVSITAVFIAFVTSLIKRLFGNKLSPEFHYYIWFVFVIRLIFPFTPESNISVYNVAANVYKNISAATEQSTGEKTNYDTQSEEYNIPVETSNIKQSEKNSIVSETSDNTTSAWDFSEQSSGFNNSESFKTNIPVTDITQQTENIPETINILTRKTITNILTLIYLIVAFVSIAIYALQYIRYTRRIKKSAIPVADFEQQFLDEIKNNLNIKKDIKLFRGKESMLINVFSPSVILANDCPETDKKAVITHELLHYKNKDNIVNIILAVIKSIYWFNPVIRYFIRRIKDDMEILCDLKSINKLEYRKKEYTMMLFNSSNNDNEDKAPSGVMKMNSNGKQLKNRIKFITSFKKPSRIASFIAVLLVSVLLVTTLTNPKVGAENNIPPDNENGIDLSAQINNGIDKLKFTEETEINNADRLNEFWNELDVWAHDTPDNTWDSAPWNQYIEGDNRIIEFVDGTKLETSKYNARNSNSGRGVISVTKESIIYLTNGVKIIAPGNTVVKITNEKTLNIKLGSEGTIINKNGTEITVLGGTEIDNEGNIVYEGTITSEMAAKMNENVIGEYIQTGLTELNKSIDYMSESTIDELARQEFEKSGLNGIIDMLGYLDLKTIDELVRREFEKSGLSGINHKEVFYYLDYTTIDELARKEYEKTGLNGLSEILWYLDETTIKELAQIEYEKTGLNGLSDNILWYLDENTITGYVRKEFEKTGLNGLSDIIDKVNDKLLVEFVSKEYEKTGLNNLFTDILQYLPQDLIDEIAKKEYTKLGAVGIIDILPYVSENAGIPFEIIGDFAQSALEPNGITILNYNGEQPVINKSGTVTLPKGGTIQLANGTKVLSRTRTTVYTTGITKISNDTAIGKDGVVLRNGTSPFCIYTTDGSMNSNNDW